MIRRKVIQSGNSLSLNMTEVLKKIDAKKGDTMVIEVNENNEIVIKKQAEYELPKNVSNDFFKVLERNLNDYDKTIKGLIDR
ncbi:AbrB family transcriptional regulator [Halalkalibacillus sediminis]|uniref:AbrB family transcriptional regulator n=1 Tax=Halalkalibacillus sediminis TaxID=2018042 RepID=A0A2I0QS34_9BACI|nr:AbrB family transcriptional regulator [Halalkalibacillus sediminis]PKR77119.1 AbrB family transcriptional regulator [Halalkalibacillus sediminis]